MGSEEEDEDFDERPEGKSSPPHHPTPTLNTTQKDVHCNKVQRKPGMNYRFGTDSFAILGCVVDFAWYNGTDQVVLRIHLVLLQAGERRKTLQAFEKDFSLQYNDPCLHTVDLSFLS